MKIDRIIIKRQSPGNYFVIDTITGACFDIYSMCESDIKELRSSWRWAFAGDHADDESFSYADVKASLLSFLDTMLEDNDPRIAQSIETANAVRRHLMGNKYVPIEMTYKREYHCQHCLKSLWIKPGLIEGNGHDLTCKECEK